MDNLYKPKKKRPNNNPNGRPRGHIDWSFVDKMLRAGVDGTSIASMLGIHPDTLYLRTCEEFGFPTFTAYAQLKRAEGLDLLKAKQYDTAMNGNVTMQIWLGKQYLDQKDKVENKVESTEVIKVTFAE